jgi:hypothetical protein
MLALLGLAACKGDEGDGDHIMTREELMKPEACKDCHPKHYREWSGSMHAYAANDPVFIAMNKRGQREAQLGKFCVNCHAPMAVLEQPNTDWTKADVEKLPDHLKGVTCYFCHNAIGSDGDHNNMIKLAGDTTMRGSIRNPVDPKVHGVAYSEFHDRENAKSSQMCGGCHDIQTPAHVNLERTFQEYKDSLFSQPDFAGFLTCQGCHMDSSKQQGVAADAPELDVPVRTLHEHLWPAVDVPLTDFPNRDALRAAVEECVLPNSVIFTGEFTGNGIGEYALGVETQAGHRQPSGSAQDRRMWLEVQSTDGAGDVVFDSGTLDEPKTTTPSLWTFHDKIFKADGSEAHMFWDAAPSDAHPDGFEQASMPELTQALVGMHFISRNFPLATTTLLDHADVKMKMRPMGLDVLQDLVDSKDLDPALLDQMPTFTVFDATLDFSMSNDPSMFETINNTNIDCDHYKCMLDPKLPGCS